MQIAWLMHSEEDRAFCTILGHVKIALGRRGRLLSPLAYGAQKSLCSLRSGGVRVIIWTTRPNLGLVGLPFVERPLTQPILGDAVPLEPKLYFTRSPVLEEPLKILFGYDPPANPFGTIFGVDLTRCRPIDENVGFFRH